jgi:hypothetical protein
MRLAVLATLLCLALPARADVVRALETGVKWAGKNRINRTLSFQAGLGRRIELDPDAGAIRTNATFFGKTIIQGGVVLQNGKVAAGDRQALADAFKDRSSRKQVILGLRKAMKQYRQEAKRLASADGKVDALLATAKKAAAESSGEVIPLHQGRDFIDFRHGASGPILIVTQGSNQRSIPLHDDGKGGVRLHPQGRADIAAALLAK